MRIILGNSVITWFVYTDGAAGAPWHNDSGSHVYWGVELFCVFVFAAKSPSHCSVVLKWNGWFHIKYHTIGHPRGSPVRCPMLSVDRWLWVQFWITKNCDYDYTTLRFMHDNGNAMTCKRPPWYWPSVGEPTGQRWIPIKKVRWCGAFMFSCYLSWQPEKSVKQIIGLLVIWGAMTFVCVLCNVHNISRNLGNITASLTVWGMGQLWYVIVW